MECVPSGLVNALNAASFGANTVNDAELIASANPCAVTASANAFNPFARAVSMTFAALVTTHRDRRVVCRGFDANAFTRDTELENEIVEDIFLKSIARAQ